LLICKLGWLGLDSKCSFGGYSDARGAIVENRLFLVTEHTRRDHVMEY